MANALSDIAGPPPAPNPNPAPPVQANALSAMASASRAAPGSQTPPNAQPPQIPAPSHQQTVAAIRHFVAIERELTGLLRDPDCGRSNLRSKIIDGAASLVGSSILTPAQSVQQLGTVPDRPFDQKKWLESQLQQAVSSGAAILDHHRAAIQGGAVPAQPADGQGYNPDDHANIMSSLVSHYQGLKNA